VKQLELMENISVMQWKWKRVEVEAESWTGMEGSKVEWWKSIEVSDE
jgi:hypothetical protein